MDEHKLLDRNIKELKKQNNFLKLQFKNIKKEWNKLSQEDKIKEKTDELKLEIRHYRLLIMNKF